jgi:phosphate transport system substrate-binding protein
MKRVASLLALFTLLFLLACSYSKRPERTDTTTGGYAKVIADECFVPMMKEQTNVFEGLNQDAEIDVRYASEKEAFKLLFQDSVRLILAARDLTLQEKEMLREKKLLPRSTKAATDGIALITNKNNTNLLITVKSVRQILNGEIRTWDQLYPGSKLGTILIVFDNAQSSTVRYMQDSVTYSRIKSPNAFAQNTNSAVIDYVAKTPNALGVIGVNWISNHADTTQYGFTDRVRVMSVSPFDEAREDNSYLPYPAYLITKQYPFSRDLYMIITDVPGYLPSGFMNFVCGERGQRIILKLGLVPANSPMRLIQVKE